MKEPLLSLTVFSTHNFYCVMLINFLLIFCGFSDGISIAQFYTSMDETNSDESSYNVRQYRSRISIPIDSSRRTHDISMPGKCVNNEPLRLGIVEWLAIIGSVLLLIVTFPLSVCASFRVVQEYERAVIFRLGRLRKGGPRGPGVFFVLPCIDTYSKVDLRTVSFNVPPQEVLTKDSVTVTVDAVVYYNIKDPLNAVVQVSNYSHSTQLLAATTLRNVLGTKSLSEILSERETIAHTMQISLDEATGPWGVKVERVEIKDVMLPVQLQKAMAAEAEASREARAKVIAAEGEMKASKALREASDVIADSPAALQLRYLQTLNTISADKNSTIIFPLPMDMMSLFVPTGKS